MDVYNKYQDSQSCHKHSIYLSCNRCLGVFYQRCPQNWVKDLAHKIENVQGLIKEMFQIIEPCLLIGTGEWLQLLHIIVMFRSLRFQLFIAKSLKQFQLRNCLMSLWMVLQQWMLKLPLNSLGNIRSKHELCCSRENISIKISPPPKFSQTKLV